MSNNRVFTADQTNKLNQVINEGMQVMNEIETLTGGLNDTVKAIAEELRGLAVEANVPIVSATQTTRSGYTSSDPGLEDTSESFGLPATADLMFALVSSEELEELNQIMVKQLKNRYNDTAINRKFIVGINRAKMKLFDVEQTQLSDANQEPETEEEEEPVVDPPSCAKEE